MCEKNYLTNASIFKSMFICNVLDIKFMYN